MSISPTAGVRPLGVGFFGAGPATQSIHLPTLARLGGLFRVVTVMDVDLALAQEIAGPAGARAVASEEELLADPEVDVVVLCSPNALHARQAVAAAERGVRAILCEKPLGTTAEEGRAVVDAVKRTGVPLLVGAMHAFDPGWVGALDRWRGELADVHAVRSTIVLPPNAAFEQAATELAPGRPPMAPPTGVPDSTRIRNSVLGLAIHDLPLVRALGSPGAPVVVRSATLLAPFGYVLDLSVGTCSVLLQAGFSAGARPSWTLEAYTPSRALTVEFTPSYVHSGSALANLRTPEGISTLPVGPVNGYEAEWRAIADIVTGRRPAPDPEELLADLEFALEVADQAAELLQESAASGAPAVAR